VGEEFRGERRGVKKTAVHVCSREKGKAHPGRRISGNTVQRGSWSADAGRVETNNWEKTKIREKIEGKSNAVEIVGRDTNCRVTLSLTTGVKRG